MRCPSCGALSDDRSDYCSECGAANAGSDTTSEPGVQPNRRRSRSGKDSAASRSRKAAAKPKTRLIEFPGASGKRVPQWRRELGERVREVQQRRAREAALEAEEAQRQREEELARAPQLNLLPQAEMPPANPLVAAALRRIERARQTPALNGTRSAPDAAAAVARAPDNSLLEKQSPSVLGPVSAKASKPVSTGMETTAPKPQAPVSKLPRGGAGAKGRRETVPHLQATLSEERRDLTATKQPSVAKIEARPSEPQPRSPTDSSLSNMVAKTEPAPSEPQPRGPTNSSLSNMVAEIEATPNEPQPKRVIAGNLDDPALNYLESMAPTITPEVPRALAPIPRRIASTLADLLIIVFLSSPVAALIELTNENWHDPRMVLLMVATVSALMFVYLTVSTALSGKTLGMSIFSLKVIDLRSGLIPTGSQSAIRAIAYIISLATLGLGILYALTDSEQRTAHDRISHTEVIRV